MPERQVTSADSSAIPNDNAQALADLRNALGPFGTCLPSGLAEATILMCAFPHWAVWLPDDDRGAWTAARPADSIAPGPEAQMVWVRAGTVGELATRMQAADSHLHRG